MNDEILAILRLDAHAAAHEAVDWDRPLHAVTYMHEAVHVPGWGWMMPSEPFDSDRPWNDNEA